MRSDMQHLLVERPRIYRGYRSRKSPGYPGGTRKNERGTRDIEGLPSRESLGKGYTQKHFNENLRPLFRFLLKSVGRPWNSVYSELCEQVQATSTVQRHILEHVHQYVRLALQRDANGWLRDLAAVHTLRYHPGYPVLYVCPRTGLLRKLARQDLPYVSWTARRIDAKTYLVKLGEAWCMVYLAVLPAEGASGCVPIDAVSKRCAHSYAFRQSVYDHPRPWDKSLYAERVRPLTKRERIEYLSKADMSFPVSASKKVGST
jgi:hypothetical protein